MNTPFHRKNTESLSDRRGCNPGLMFFRLFLRVFGLRQACVMVRIVTFFYALADSGARAKALPYIRRRFPCAGPFRRFFHIWALFAGQGRALLMQEAVIQNMTKPDIVYLGHSADDVLFSGKPFVLLYSHFGPWQCAMTTIDVSRNCFSILMKQDLVARLDKMRALQNDLRMERIHVISTDAPLGGLWDCDDALARGECIAIMGDRCYENKRANISFLGEEASFPMAGFVLAAKHHCPVVMMFSHSAEQGKRFHVEVGNALFPVMRGRDRSSLVPYVEQYVRILEKHCMENPYDFFLFDDIWSVRA